MNENRKTYIYLLAILIMVVVSVVVYLKDSTTTLDPGLTDFDLSKDETPDSIVISQKDNEIILKKKSGGWVMGSEFPVNQKEIDNLFYALENLVVEAPVRESSKETVIDLVEQNPISVQIFEQNLKIKDYLIEDSPYKEDMTYMMIKGAKEPFIMNIPGYEGDIAEFFRPEKEKWRSKEIFDYTGVEIVQVKVVYPEDSTASFVLHYPRDNQFLIESIHNRENTFTPDNARASRYLSYFSGIEYESVLDSNQLRDSLAQEKPYCKFHVEDESGNKTSLVTYRKAGGEAEDAFGQTAPYDLNYLYGYYNELGEILLIKYTEIDPLLKEIDYFRVE
ncbi:MAG: DUF4340 domain-containing protein [Bacteroidales bacterium]